VALKVPITINYTFSQGNVRPYLSFGISNTFVLSQNKDFIFYDVYNKYNKSIRTYLGGFVGRAGSEFVIKNNHSIFIDIDVDYCQTLSGSTVFILRNMMYSLTAGFKF
jgi:outer membrane protein W